MERIPKPQEIYRHFKGNLYQVITLAKHSETGEEMVVYQALYGDFGIYVRPLSMFVSLVDHEKYPDVKEKYRFTLMISVPEPAASEKKRQAAEEKTEPTVFDGNSQMAEEKPEPMPLAGTERIAEEKQQEIAAAELGKEEEPEPALDPLLAAFLDAETMEEKLTHFAAMHAKITQDMLNTVAVSLDFEIEGDDLEKQYEELKNCMLTRKRYEGSRLRW